MNLKVSAKLGGCLSLLWVTQLIQVLGAGRLQNCFIHPVCTSIWLPKAGERTLKEMLFPALLA